MWGESVLRMCLYALKSLLRQRLKIWSSDLDILLKAFSRHVFLFVFLPRVVVNVWRIEWQPLLLPERTSTVSLDLKKNNWTNYLDNFISHSWSFLLYKWLVSLQVSWYITKEGWRKAYMSSRFTWTPRILNDINNRHIVCFSFLAQSSPGLNRVVWTDRMSPSESVMYTLNQWNKDILGHLPECSIKRRKSNNLFSQSPCCVYHTFRDAYCFHGMAQAWNSWVTASGGGNVRFCLGCIHQDRVFCITTTVHNAIDRSHNTATV
jgi:hypothetical protein